MLKVLKSVKDAEMGFDLYEAITEAWDFVVAENTSQRSLVTPAQWRAWENTRTSFEEKLLKVGNDFLQTKQWNVGALSSMRHLLLESQRESPDSLRAKRAAEQCSDESKEREVGKVRALVNRFANR